MSARREPTDAEKEEVNYFLEMVKHRGNFWGLMGGLAAGSIVAIVTGIAPAILIPVVAQAGLNGILGLFLPDSPFFREMIDRKKREERRATTRTYLVEEIGRRVPGQHHNWEVYHRLVDQLKALRRTAKDQETTLSLYDVEKLDDSTLDYLRLWLARIIIHERQESSDERKIAARLREVEKELAADDLPFMDRQRMDKAKADLEKVLDRRRSYQRTEHSMAASMIALADAFTELHQRITANPTGEDWGSHVEKTVERMSVVEQLDFAADFEIQQAVALSQGAREAVATALDAEALRPAGSTRGRGQKARTRR